MNLLCLLFGHNYILDSESVEDPYKGKYRVDGEKPYSSRFRAYFCLRCQKIHKNHTYFFNNEVNE